MSGTTLSSTARRALAVIRGEGVVTVNDLADVLGLPEAVLEDSVSELLEAGAVLVDVVGALEVLRCPDEDAA